ncbi:hypothetical protein O6H91_07G048500 [Diphasiastrum complanatum]|uniref:Uncharacterized protein n=2 Tax=Diphasiastrum complanatum TaxID=34168 RepID=A0ACC2D510_DIPCM|nr:hypothetical protein O6H91_07G048500 [Diphasiastrum complanatum]KAJ7549303.1 hypothetical protein O6H91_07G048500 [Diphasiastrum complanatum]
MEPELDPRLKALPFKVRSMSRESQSQKAVNVIDSDLRTHWSTGTNTKEWLLLELEESCLLSHIRIHNKSVLEWEISVGLRFKPDTFLKVRPRCEAPRRDIMYHIGYTPCRYVRISCLRGNPIAIFFIQLIGIAVPGLEPEFQPVVDYLVPQIISRKQDHHDMYLQLLQDLTSRLSPFLPHLETELTVGSESMESSIRFFAMLVGPFYPILCVIGGRENEKVVPVTQDSEPNKISQAAVFTVSSNFQAPPRRVRSPGLSHQHSGHALAFRPDSILLLLRMAYKENSLGIICRKIARIFRKIAGQFSTVETNVAVTPAEANTSATLGVEILTVSTDLKKSFTDSADYSPIFGEDFRELSDDISEVDHAGVLESALVEEGLLHILYACASQPMVCRRLADVKSDLSQVLPFVQAMLPALRPPLSTSTASDQVDDSFWQWQALLVQRVLIQVVALSTSPTYRPLLDACAGYLASYSAAHKKTACVLIDLCAGPLAPWLTMVVAKVDLAVELIEDLLGVIQAAHRATSRARSALIYLMLALSGHMDAMLTQYKEAKHNLLFIIEMLEPFLTPALTPVESTIAFGDVSAVILEKQDQTCALALEILHTAAKRPDILPAMEVEWRQGQVTPSVLLSILAPQLPLPPGLDFHRHPVDKIPGVTILSGITDVNKSTISSAIQRGGVDESANGVPDVELNLKVEVNEDGSGLFVPSELKLMSLQTVSAHFESAPTENQTYGNFAPKVEGKPGDTKDEKPFVLNEASVDEYFNLQADYLQLVNIPEREIRASEFVRFAAELHVRMGDSIESHDAAIDALLLAAECHLNPFFMISTNDYNQMMNRLSASKEEGSTYPKKNASRASSQEESLKVVASLEEGRDKAVIQILLQAAEWDSDISNSNLTDTDFDGAVASDFEGLFVAEEDKTVEDTITLVRRHQDLLCWFLIRQLQREKHNLYEVLLQGLLFVLNSATKLSSAPEDIVNVILDSAERLNASIIAYQAQAEESIEARNSVTVYGIKRQWALVVRLVLASTGGGSGIDAGNLSVQGHLLQRDLVPSWVWLDKISAFSSSSYPLVRYVGWMALAELAKLYETTGLLLVSDVQQLTGLLLIFSDELASVQRLKTWKSREVEQHSETMVDELFSDSSEKIDKGGLVKALYPELEPLFPELRSHFSQFAETMLEAICLHLRAVSPNSISDLLTWFSELCRDPFPAVEKDLVYRQRKIGVKGFAVENVKYIVTHLLEVIVIHHMEAILPELPRILDVLLSLCRSSYCDVTLLDSVLSVLKPIISHAAATAATNRYTTEDLVSSVSFEGLCFDAMMEALRSGPVGDLERSSSGSLLLFLAGSLLSDISMLRRIELISSFSKWVNFTDSNLTNSYYDFIFAFQRILEVCCSLLEGSLEEVDISTFRGIPPCPSETSNSPTMPNHSLTPPSTPQRSSVMSADIGSCINGMDPDAESLVIPKTLETESNEANEDGDRLLGPPSEVSEVNCELQGDDQHIGDPDLDAQKVPIPDLTDTNLMDFVHCLEALLIALGPPLERSWKVHAQLTLKLTRVRSHCILYLRYIATKHAKSQTKLGSKHKTGSLSLESEEEKALVMWHIALDDLVQLNLTLQHNHCWQVAAASMDFVFSLPASFSIHKVLPTICSVLRYQSSHAPQLRWRLWTCKWLAEAIVRVRTEPLKPTPSSLLELLCTMLEHPEPEQRSGALKQLGILVKGHLHYGVHYSESLEPSVTSNSTEKQAILVDKFPQDSFGSMLVSATWDKVASLARGDSLMGIQRQAMELLYQYVPLAQSHQLRTFLSSIDVIFPGSMTLPYTMKSGSLLRLSLGIFARACLYCSTSDISAIPHRVWSNVEFMASTKPGNIFVETERAVCLALLQLREHGHAAKQTVREALSNVSEKMEPDPNFAPVRETILEVLGRLNAVRATADAYLLASAEEAKVLEEAEIELELLKEEEALHKTSGRKNEQLGAGLTGASLAMKDRLEKVREQLHAEELAATRAEIAARRERQRLAQHERQIVLEEATLREIELLQDLDRERAAEAEREIERRRLLEKERAKTRELRHILELDSERRTQREYQRELEQRESGAVRSSRREFTSTTSSSRPRERYRERERESGRTIQEVNPQAHIVGVRENSSSPMLSAPPSSTPTLTIVSTAPTSTSAVNPGSSNRAYPGQTLSFASTRDRNEDRVFDDLLGQGINRDPIDSSSYMDMDGISMEAGSASNLASHRQGSRTSRPRQIVERRERESRREGKWERKQS